MECIFLKKKLYYTLLWDTNSIGYNFFGEVLIERRERYSNPWYK
jgi:hypothetical protein